LCLLRNLSHHPQHSADDVAHSHLSGLSCDKTPAYIPNAVDELLRIVSDPLSSNDAKEELGRGDGALTRVSDLSPLEERD
jgi:hypothetical protein